MTALEAFLNGEYNISNQKRYASGIFEAVVVNTKTDLTGSFSVKEENGVIVKVIMDEELKPRPPIQIPPIAEKDNNGRLKIKKVKK